MNIIGAMAAVEMLTEKLGEEIQLLHERVDAKPWGSYTRTSFVYSLTHTVRALEEIAALIEQIMLEFRKEGLSGYPDSVTTTKEIHELILVLKRNQRMEEDALANRKARIAELGDAPIHEEQYASLEQRVLSVLLKTRYLTERTGVYLKKQGTSGFSHSGKTRNILELLEQKETELQQMKGKYEEIRNRSALGTIEQESAADLEKELGEISSRLAGEDSRIEDGIISFRKQLEMLNVKQAELTEKIRGIREMQARHSEKTAELIAMLKKERDYAKRIVLDIENETLQLRNTYSRELLSLEDEKIRAKNDAYEKFKERVGKQGNELNESRELARHLREAVEAREQKIRLLEDKISAMKESGKGPQKKAGKRGKK